MLLYMIPFRLSSLVLASLNNLSADLPREDELISNKPRVIWERLEMKRPRDLLPKTVYKSQYRIWKGSYSYIEILEESMFSNI